VGDSILDRHPVEILAAEFVERYRRGERPSLSEYTARHPDQADQIRALFPAVVMMEDLKHGRAPAENPFPERLGDCRILREVGRGGMGVVYEAEQESLGRRVAVKVLTAPALLDPEQLHRLHREAQAMARLHHTNIVPVFGIHAHDGLSYLVMQFIDGRGLDQEIADWKSRIADRSAPRDRQAAICHPQRVAQVGLQVAEAMAYAHRQGVLHRDIKPSNLLLDGRGTVWVTDFGLAKLVEQDEASRPSETAGTLRYMAPERFRGQSDVRSDVYGLGLTLYEMLTLRPAFDEVDRGRLVHQVTQEEPPAPRKYNATIPRDLETVVLRALARDPEHRYQSAEALAEDLRRFLEDRPVTARRVSTAERLGRWCRRNPAVASLTALTASLLVLVAVLASVGYVQTRAALGREAEQRQEAIGERQRAEANLRLALQAFEEISAQITRSGPQASHPAPDDEDAPACPPVVSPEVAALLNTLLKFYDQFGEGNHADPRLQREIARAHRRLGDIQQRLGQFATAETAYRRALVVLDGRAAIGGLEGTHERAAVQNDLGLVLQMTGRYAEAEAAHREALRELRVQLMQAPESDACRYELARAHTLLGSLLGKMGRVDQVEENHRRALHLLQRFRKTDADNPEYRIARARSQWHLHNILAVKGRFPEAGMALQKAASILEKLAEDFPAVPDYRYELGEVLIQLPTRGRGPDRDEQQLRRAVDLAKDLAAAYPAVPQYQALRARALQRLGFFFQMAGRRGEAEKFYREAVALHRTVAERCPGVPFYQLYRAEACESLGRLLLHQEQLAAACKLMEEAIAAQRAFVKATPGNRYGRFVLAREYQTLATALRRQGDTEQSKEAERRAGEVKKGG
jgi:tetratricopeptide (TPR) repeat protein/tRNA A-37 threonylcarbamoyl transferase component Bud32